MNLKIKNIVFTICLNFVILYASVADYQEIYQEEQKEFNQQMSDRDQKGSVTSSSKKVQELYRAINYQPIWVDKDYLTQYRRVTGHMN